MHLPAFSSAIPVPQTLRQSSSMHAQPDMCATFSLTGTHSRTVEPNWSYPRHDHPYFELCLLDAGEQHVRLTGHTLLQRVHDVLLVCPFDAHASSAPHGASLFCVHFDVDELALRRLLCRAGTRLFSAASATATDLREGLERMREISIAANVSPGIALLNRLQTSAALFNVLASLAAEILEQDGHLSELPQVALQTASRLAELIERQVEHGDAGFSIESAIRRLGYHPDYGNALFRQVYGVSARHYRSLVKLRRAKLLLLDGEISVGEVASRLGYSDTAHFSRQFKRWSGQSPVAYRSAPQSVAA